jgi:hypothetical protein
MNRRLLTRLEKLEATMAPQLVSLVRYGWLATLPASYVGERHIVTLKCEATGSPRFEWCEWEELPERAPVVGLREDHRWGTGHPAAVGR